MRLLGGISCAVLCSSLIGCLPTVAETVEINGKSYRTGFYGDCYLMDDLPLSGLEYELDEITYRALQHPEFDLWYNGSDSVMYCAEDQWEAAKTYYADDQQYLYYCSVGVTIKDQTEPTIYDISGKVDTQKYYQTIGTGEGGYGRYYLYSATNVRLQELSLSYTLPKKWLNNVATFGLVGRNLWMIYCKAPFDPELSASTSSNYYMNVDYFMQPSMRNIGFNVKVQF